MKKRNASIALAALIIVLSVTGCSDNSLSGMQETAAESGENSEKKKNAASDQILEGHEIDHPIYGKLIVSGDLWAVCEDVEKETDGEISAEKAAWVLYYEEEDSHGTEAESALTEAKEGLYNTIQAQNTMMNNNSIQILGEKDDYFTHQYTFGGIADAYDRFMMDVAGACETPVTKLFGRSPAGMNATGESDMQNYYDTIEEKQETTLRPIFDKLLPIVVMSALGAIPDDFDFEFKPVRKPNDNEMADLASKNTDSVTKAFQAGMISQRTALKELRQQSEQTGMWSNITDEDIEKADDDVVKLDEGMMGMPFGDDKEDHPRKT